MGRKGRNIKRPRRTGLSDFRRQTSRTKWGHDEGLRCRRIRQIGGRRHGTPRRTALSVCSLHSRYFISLPSSLCLILPFPRLPPFLHSYCSLPSIFPPTRSLVPFLPFLLPPSPPLSPILTVPIISSLQSALHLLLSIPSHQSSFIFLDIRGPSSACFIQFIVFLKYGYFLESSLHFPFA